MKVSFSPSGEPSDYSMPYIIVGDNGFTDPFTLEGQSCSPLFEVVSISGNDLSNFPHDDKFENDFILHDLLFDSLNPATRQTKTGKRVT